MSRKETSAYYKIVNTMVVLFLALVMTLVFVVFYYAAIDANPPLSVIEPMTFSVETAEPGETILMTTSFCKHTDSTSLLTAFWQNEEGELNSITVNELSVSGEGCDTLDIPVSIPDEIAPGLWKRVNIGEYHPNPIAERTVRWESEYLEILEASEE